MIVLRDFSADQRQTHDIFQLVGAIIGLVVSLFGVIILIYQRQLVIRSSGMQLILCLFCCFVVYSLNRVIRYALDPLPLWYCYTFGCVNQLTRCVLFAYELAIAYFLYRIVVLGDTNTLQILPITHWMIWSWSLLLTALPATTFDYWPPDCYLNSATRTGQIWMLITILIPLMCYMLAILVWLSLVSYTLWSQRTTHPHQKGKSIMMLLRIPVIFVICWIPYLIYRFQILAQDDNNFALEMAGAVGTNLHPILTVVSFSWSPLIKCIQHISESRYRIDVSM